LIVLHIITGLNNGGAEGVLYRLCKYDSLAKHIVVSMMDEGKYGPTLKAEGIEVHCLNFQQGSVSLSGMLRLFKLIRQNKPEIVQTWMYHADLIGGVVSRLAGVKNVFWNVRNTTLVPGESKRSTIWTAKICARLSGMIPRRIICCAQEAVRVHSDLGYNMEKMSVIGNGYDLSFFSPSDGKGYAFKKDIKLRPDSLLLGMVGRFDQQKDHFGLLRALSIVKNSIPFFCFALIGRDLNPDNHKLNKLIKKYDLEKNIFLLDQRNDIPNVMNGLDIHCLSSSFGEAFPNVLAEAMACGTPCVTTDVGDAALIIGDTGWVVPPKDPQALANAILQAIAEKQNNHHAWSVRKQACRNRIAETFDIETMIKNYHRAWGY